MQNTSSSAITFAEICEVEPKVRVLFEKARAANEDPTRPCAIRVWHGDGRSEGLKNELGRLVGWARESDSPRIATAEAYDVAYRTIFRELPDCDGRCCIGEY